MDSMLFSANRARSSATPIHVRSSSRKTLLDALEYAPILSRIHLGELTELGETTLRHAVRQLSREGILTPQSGRNAGTISIARYSALPILEISPHRLTWRLCDTLGSSVVATVRDRGKFRSLEDDLVALRGQVETILRGGACDLPREIPLQPPVLLCPDYLIPTSLPLWTPPSAVLTPEEAVAGELRFLPVAQAAEAALLLHVGEDAAVPTVTLFTRRNREPFPTPFTPSSDTADLGQTLLRDVGESPAYTEVWWRRIAAFLEDLLRFIRLDCVIVEIDRPQEHAHLLRASLPSTVKLLRVRYALNTPSLSHRGALRVARRALWESMEETSPAKATARSQ